MLGFVGLSHSGIHTLSKMVFGKIRAERGRIYAKGKQIKSIRQALKNKIVYINEEFELCDIQKALGGRSEIIIADSVLTKRECGEAKEIAELLQKKCAEGCGVLFVSEDIDEQILLCDRITVLHAGNICAEADIPIYESKKGIMRAVIGEGVEDREA